MCHGTGRIYGIWAGLTAINRPVTDVPYTLVQHLDISLKRPLEPAAEGRKYSQIMVTITSRDKRLHHLQAQLSTAAEPPSNLPDPLAAATALQVQKLHGHGEFKTLSPIQSSAHA